MRGSKGLGGSCRGLEGVGGGWRGLEGVGGGWRGVLEGVGGGWRGLEGVGGSWRGLEGVGGGWRGLEGVGGGWRELEGVGDRSHRKGGFPLPKRGTPHGLQLRVLAVSKHFAAPSSPSGATTALHRRCCPAAGHWKLHGPHWPHSAIRQSTPAAPADRQGRAHAHARGGAQPNGAWRGMSHLLKWGIAGGDCSSPLSGDPIPANQALTKETETSLSPSHATHTHKSRTKIPPTKNEIWNRDPKNQRRILGTQSFLAFKTPPGVCAQLQAPSWSIHVCCSVLCVCVDGGGGGRGTIKGQQRLMSNCVNWD